MLLLLCQCRAVALSIEPESLWVAGNGSTASMDTHGGPGSATNAATPNPDTNVDTDAATDADIQKAARLSQMLAPERATRYSSWMRVGFALHGVHTTRLRAAFHEFSARTPARNYDRARCDEFWDGVQDRVGGGGVTLGTLVAWAREDAGALAVERVMGAVAAATAGRGRWCGEDSE